MNSNQYSPEDLVWAKVKGCSWWPGVISSIDKSRNGIEAQVTVNFLGDNSHAVIPIEKVISYRDGYKQFTQTKKRSLLDAIETADKIVNGTTSYEAEKKKIAKKGLKRKVPERNTSTDNSIINTRLSSRILKQKEVEKTDNIMQPIFKLKRTQNFFKKLVGQTSKAILMKKAKIEESLKEIIDEKPTVDQLKISKLGHDLQLFVNSCSKTPLLTEIKNNTQSVLDELKKQAITALFGEELNNSSPAQSIEESEPKEKNQSSEIKEPSVKEVKILSQSVKVSSEVSPDELKEIPIVVKEPAIMLVVCKEIVDLLKKVLKCVKWIEIDIERERGDRDGIGDRSKVSC